MVSRTTRQAARAYQKAHEVPYAEALRRVLAEDRTESAEKPKTLAGGLPAESNAEPASTMAKPDGDTVAGLPSGYTPHAVINYLDGILHRPPQERDFTETDFFYDPAIVEFHDDLYAEACQEWDEKLEPLRRHRQAQADKNEIDSDEVKRLAKVALRGYAKTVEFEQQRVAHLVSVLHNTIAVARQATDLTSDEIAELTGLQVAEVEALIEESGE
jgi:hypothetical protein